MIKLSHYVHCPFCVRVRMALGYLDIPFESQVLPYNDEETPLKLCSKKMLPIMEFESGPLNESLDIIRKLDEKNQLVPEDFNEDELDEVLKEIGDPVHNLAMPYWIYTPEFNDESRKYFVQKKSKKRGPFHKLVENKQIYIKDLNQTLLKIEPILTPYYQSGSLGIKDIMIASHLWGMYIVPEFQFPMEIHKYLQDIAHKCRFDYHKDFWKEDRWPS